MRLSCLPHDPPIGSDRSFFGDLHRYRSNAKHFRHHLPSSTFTMKTMHNFIHICYEDLFCVQDSVPRRTLIGMQDFETWQCFMCLSLDYSPQIMRGQSSLFFHVCVTHIDAIQDSRLGSSVFDLPDLCPQSAFITRRTSGLNKKLYSLDQANKTTERLQ